METGKTIAVVTGASCGMGTEFVRQIGEQKPLIEEVWAIARNREALEKLQREVSKVRVFALDITSPKDLDTLAGTSQDSLAGVQRRSRSAENRGRNQFV